MGSDKPNNEFDSFAEQVGKSLGKLHVIAIYQARATMILAEAIKNDPAVSPATKKAAEASLIEVDRVIEVIEDSVDNDLRGGVRHLLRGFNDE